MADVSETNSTVPLPPSQSASVLQVYSLPLTVMFNFSYISQNPGGLPGTWCTPDARWQCSAHRAHQRRCCQCRGRPGSPSGGRTGPEERIRIPQLWSVTFAPFYKQKNKQKHLCGFSSYPVQRVCVERVAGLLPLAVTLWLETDLPNAEDVALLLLTFTMSYLQHPADSSEPQI